MRIHHLNCITSCPLGGRLMTRGPRTAHCLLVETDAGLVLIDTGFGLRDVAHPRMRLSRACRTLLRPHLRPELTAIRQIQELGWRAHDVRHIVLSQLGLDHAGGLDDFPEATVHVLDAERAAAEARRSFVDRMRYQPAQWIGSRDRWRTYAHERGERFYGFTGVQQLDGLPPELLLVPLRGPTLGHAGVAVRRRTGWLFYTGDAYRCRGEVDDTRPGCPLGLRLVQRLLTRDPAARRTNLARLRTLVRDVPEVELYSAHDAAEFERLAGRSPALPNSIFVGSAHRFAPLEDYYYAYSLSR